MLQQYRHHNGLKRPKARYYDARLDVQLGAIKESIEDGLIGFRESPFERRPSAAFILNKLTKRRKGLTYGSGLLLMELRTTGNSYRALQRDSMGDVYINDLLIYQSIVARRSLLFSVFPPLPIA